MKKFLKLSAFVFIALTANAQYVTYQSTYDRVETSQAPVQTIYGYIKTNKGWVRLTLKVQETAESIKVVGYRQKNTGSYVSYGDPNPWCKCNAYAQRVTTLSDGQTVANNFDYKVYISSLGTVYF